jgi:hypothetical protein
MDARYGRNLALVIVFGTSQVQIPARGLFVLTQAFVIFLSLSWQISE